MKYLSKILPGSSTSHDHESSNSKKTTKLHDMKSQIPVKHCAWLLVTIFLQFLILFTLMRSASEHNQQLKVPHINPECQFGYVYVYDLPKIFNSELVAKCHENLDPWKKSRCMAVSNGGFGPKAIGLNHKGVVPRNLSSAWYWTDMYAGDIIYHKRMLNYKCRTLQPEKATAFYIPFYAGLDVARFLWFNYTDRDRHSEMVLDWLSEQPFFTRSEGADHFIMLGRLTWDFRRLVPSGWGSSLLTNMTLMKKVLHLSVEKHLNDDFEESVPYPTAFHPRSASELVQWQDYIRSKKRTTLFSFVGGRRESFKNDFRKVLLDYCADEEEPYCRGYDCGDGARCSDGIPDIMETFLDSDFCLQPRGNGVTRRSIFDCLLAGSIPVYFWKETLKGQYEWHLPWTSESFAVFIDHRDVRSTNGTVIRKVLENIHREKVKEMRENLINNLLPKLIYSSSPQGLGTVKDAFDITAERVLKRFNYFRKDRSAATL